MGKFMASENKKINITKLYLNNVVAYDNYKKIKKKIVSSLLLGIFFFFFFFIKLN